MDMAYSYMRFSSPKQSDGDSIRRQVAGTAEWCQRNGALLDQQATFQDLGKSAFRGAHRKNPARNALAAFLRLVEEGKVARGSYLVIENLDRLTREHIRPALTLLLNLIENGVRVVQLKPAEQIFDENVEPMQLMMAIMELSRGNSESQMKSAADGCSLGREEGGSQAIGKAHHGAAPGLGRTAGWKAHRGPRPGGDGRDDLSPVHRRVRPFVDRQAPYRGQGPPVRRRRVLEQGVPAQAAHRACGFGRASADARVGTRRPADRRLLSGDHRPG